MVGKVFLEKSNGLGVAVEQIAWSLWRGRSKGRSDQQSGQQGEKEGLGESHCNKVGLPAQI